MNNYRKLRARTGYLLVTVVVMIAVASLMLSRMASTSMRVASTAIEEEIDLRHRWAVTSLRRFSLDKAATILDANSKSVTFNKSETIAKPILWRQANLGGETWRVIIGDESAKLNLRLASQSFVEQVTSNLIDELLNDKGMLKASDVLPSMSRPAAGRWENWLSTPKGDLATSARHVATATQRMTLWGNGRLNVMRCETETLDVLWHQLFGRNAPPTLHRLRTQSPPPSKNQMFQMLALRESQSQLAERWLSTQSDCFSVWIFCETDRRVASTLYVDWGDPPTAQEHRGYEY